MPAAPPPPRPLFPTPPGITPDPVPPGGESVWAYPRPARAEPCARHIRIEHGGRVLADTRRSIRTLETSHPPSYYIPPEDIDLSLIVDNPRQSFCEWKGQAGYVDVVIGRIGLRAVGWRYAEPTADFALLRDCIAFYAAPFDACFVDGERVVPQPGAFYGGWITSDLAGPFKGGPGSMGW